MVAIEIRGHCIIVIIGIVKQFSQVLCCMVAWLLKQALTELLRCDWCSMANIEELKDLVAQQVREAANSRKMVDDLIAQMEWAAAFFSMGSIQIGRNR